MEVLVLANNMMSDAAMAAAFAAADCNMVRTGSVENALALLAASKFDVVVVDFRPDFWGHQAICKLRIAQVELPVLFVSACSTADAVQRAYDVGADDVVTLPLEQRELKRRLTSMVRGACEPAQIRSVTVGSLEIDLVDHGARVDGKSVALSADEYDALAALACHAAGKEARGDADITVARLCRKLTKAGAAEAIRHVRGFGYTLGARRTVRRVRPVALRRAA